jgi:hypothetical protein
MVTLRPVVRNAAEIATAAAETVRLAVQRESPRRRLVAAGAIVAMLAGGCLLSTTTRGDEPASRSASRLAVAPRGGDYQFAVGFSGEQGRDTWSYLEWNGTDYTPMNWDGRAARWRGECQDCAIGRTEVRPGSNDAVIAWTAPRTGPVAVRGTIDHQSAKPTGDGVRAFVRQRSGAEVKKVWPSADHQDLAPGFMANLVFTTTVKAGDQLLFHLNQGGNAAGDGTGWNPRVTYDYQPQFTLDRAEPVMTPEDFKRAGIKAIDASLSMVHNGTSMDFYHSESGTDIQKFRGTLERPVQASVYAGPGRLVNPRQVDGKWWIENIYQTADGALLAFCHVEQADPTTSGWWAGGLAYSTDGGQTFTILGKTIATQLRDTNGAGNNIAGMPYVIKDGYFYVYFTEAGQPAVARAPVAEVLDAARRGTVSLWSKYYNGGWESGGRNGPASPIITASTVNDYGTHGDAAYSTYLKRYILVGGTGGSGRGVYLAFGDDVASFDVPSWIQSGSTTAPSLSPYETIVNTDGTDNGVVGQSFYVYFAYFFDWSLPAGHGLTNPRQWVYRQKVTLHSEGFDLPWRISSAQYSAKQGEHGWRYLEYNGTDYAELRWDDSSLRWQGSNRFTQISSQGLHPDGHRDTVLAWTADQDGTVDIGALGGISVATGPGADGVAVKIMQGDTAVWPSSGYQALPPGQTTQVPRLRVTVKHRDVLYFHLRQGEQGHNTASDATTWVPTIRYVKTGG